MVPDSASSEPVTVADIVEAVSYLRAENARLVRALAAEHDLGSSDMRAMYFIATHPGSTAGQVGERLGITTGATTALLDRLDRHGHIERRPHASDRRSVTLYATEGGRSVIDHNRAVYVETLQPVLEGVDLEALHESLEVMAGAFRDAAARQSGAPRASSRE